MKYLIIRKLNNVALQMIKRLFERAEELNLNKKDLFVLTSKAMIESRLQSYILGFKLGESLSIKSFVLEAQDIITSFVVIAKEDYLSI